MSSGRLKCSQALDLQLALSNRRMGSLAAGRRARFWRALAPPDAPPASLMCLLALLPVEDRRHEHVVVDLDSLRADES